MPRLRLFAFFLISVIALGCDPPARYGGTLSRPIKGHVGLSDDTLTKFNSDLCDTLFRYLAGNPRWEMREERGLKYAVRLERVEGAYETTLNGFYSTHEHGEVRQTRVLLSFGKSYGFGRDRGNTTRIAPGSNDVSLIVEGDHAGTPGNSSYTIVDGGQIFLEVFDEAPDVERKFTQVAFNEVCAELRDVLHYRHQIDETGVLPIATRYPKPLATEKAFVVKEGWGTAIYLAEAAVNPTEPGLAYIKAYRVDSGERLSPESLTEKSTRYVGWSKAGKTYFPYGSEVVVYDGDSRTPFKVRFELWHRSARGAEAKLAETTRMVIAWER
jgi:hypothetical protein